MFNDDLSCPMKQKQFKEKIKNQLRKEKLIEEAHDEFAQEIEQQGNDDFTEKVNQIVREMQDMIEQSKKDREKWPFQINIGKTKPSL